MKCHKPDSDQEAEVTVQFNDYACHEFVLPSTRNADPNALECFIPVFDGEKITIKGKFRGTVLHGSIDLLVDGSFVGRSSIWGKNQQPKRYNHKIKFGQGVLTCTEQPENDDVRYRTPVVEGELVARPLHGNPHKGTTQTGHGIGSIVVIISVNDQVENGYAPTPPYSNNIKIGRWKDLDDGQDGGIVPDHQLAFNLTNDDVHPNRQSKFHRHAKETRFGNKPWATFVFYYRSRKAIKDAGCVDMPNQSYALEERDVHDATVAVDDGTNDDEREEIRPKARLFGQTLSAEVMARYPPAALSPETEQIAELDYGSDVPTPNIAHWGYGSPSERSISSDGASPEGPPAKKQRMSDKRSSLLAVAKRNAERNNASKKTLGDRKKVKEAKEREQRELEAAEAEEIERLERLIAEQDQEHEEIEEARALVDAEIEEINQGW